MSGGRSGLCLIHKPLAAVSPCSLSVNVLVGGPSDGQYLSACVLVPVHGAAKVAVPQHAPPQKRQRDALGEEDAVDAGRDGAEGIPHAAHDNVLKHGGTVRQRLSGLDEPIAHELVGELQHCRTVSLWHPRGRETRDAHRGTATPAGRPSRCGRGQRATAAGAPGRGRRRDSRGGRWGRESWLLLREPMTESSDDDSGQLSGWRRRQWLAAIKVV